MPGRDGATGQDARDFVARGPGTCGTPGSRRGTPLHQLPVPTALVRHLTASVPLRRCPWAVPYRTAVGRRGIFELRVLPMGVRGAHATTAESGRAPEPLPDKTTDSQSGMTCPSQPSVACRHCSPTRLPGTPEAARRGTFTSRILAHGKTRWRRNEGNDSGASADGARGEPSDRGLGPSATPLKMTVLKPLRTLLLQKGDDSGRGSAGAGADPAVLVPSAPTPSGDTGRTRETHRYLHWRNQNARHPDAPAPPHLCTPTSWPPSAVRGSASAQRRASAGAGALCQRHSRGLEPRYRPESSGRFIWIRSQRLPYRSRKTATIPYASRRGASSNTTPAACIRS